jgi:Big-like domain-containing protein
MTGRLAGTVLLMCAGAIACGDDPSLGPRPCIAGSVGCGTPLPAASTFTKVDLSPTTVDLDQGAQQPLSVVLRDQSGARFNDNFYRIAYTSSDMSVATVVNGIVRTWAPGTVTITVAVTSGDVTRSAAMTTRVRPVAPLDSVILSEGKDGWQPSVTHVVAGGNVQWRSGPVNWAGLALPTVWVSERTNLSAYDSLDLRGGSASYRFAKAGVYFYCTGGCWDTQDWGYIFVH